MTNFNDNLVFIHKHTEIRTTFDDSVQRGRPNAQEVARLIGIQQEKREERREQFQDKLVQLKERQESLQRRRVNRLQKEGIDIDLDAILTRKLPPPVIVNDQLDINALNAQIRSMLKVRGYHDDAEICSEPDETIYENESELALSRNLLHCSSMSSLGLTSARSARSSEQYRRKLSRADIAKGVLNFRREMSRVSDSRKSVSSIAADDDVFRTDRRVKSVAIKEKKSEKHKKTKNRWKRLGAFVKTARYLNRTFSNKTTTIYSLPTNKTMTSTKLKNKPTTTGRPIVSKSKNTIK